MANKWIDDNVISNFLNITLVDNSIIFINLWSFVHLMSGFLLYKYVTQDPIKLLILLIAYEMIEFSLIGIMFKQESFADVLWDIIMAVIGIFIASRFI